MNPTLVVLAAGIGSRYGGLKQIEPVGPNGAIVIDYSVFDALRAGFGRVVCVIRRDIEADFRRAISSRFERFVPVDYVYQDLADVPAGFAAPAERKKPWGTGHAILAARDAVREPFAVINADDFYGRQSYQALALFLRAADPAGHRYAMVGFRLNNTLSEHGSVARGVCELDANGCLRRVVERTRIERTPLGVRYTTDDGQWHPLTGQEAVSLNLWAFTPTLFPHLQRQFADFLAARGQDPKAEFFIPTVVDALVAAGQATVRVLPTPEQWYGVTYPADKAAVSAGIGKLVADGVYPDVLWPKP
jgi:UTP-glucose-1-phosphate uridylyltransferase